MREFEIELEVGDVVSIGDYSVSLLDIDGDIVILRVNDFSDLTEASEMLSDGLKG